jgi:hypothetical protein
MMVSCGFGLLAAFQRNPLPPSSGYKSKPDEKKWSVICGRSVGWEIVVGIATHYRLDGPGIESPPV